MSRGASTFGAGGLFALCTTIWGSTWLVITFQLGVVAPEVSVVWRFGLAAAMLALFCVATRRSLRFAPGDHARMAVQGALMFCGNYVLVYWAEQHVVSGLVAVVFSLFTFMSLFAQRAVDGLPIARRAVAGAALGVGGVALLFLPEIVDATRGDRDTLLGIGFALAGTLAATLGNLMATRVHARGLPIVPTTAWAMAYGTLATAILAVAVGAPWSFDARAPYVASLVYLALAGSVIAFVAYLALMREVGMARASYVGVSTPVLAMALSTAFEGYRPTLYTFVGMALAVVGNLTVLWRRRVVAPR
jgi:drug/metabolite transporter (DMT)-like permease